MIINPFIFAAPFTNTKSLLFDGVDDKVLIGTSLNLGTDSTVSFWLKRGASGVADVFLGEDSYQWNYCMYVESNNKIWIRIGLVGKEWGSASVIALMNQTTSWTHVLFVRTGDSIELFLNGSSMGSQTGFGTVTDTRFDAIASKALNNVNNANGNFDEVSGWNTALSASQVTDIYNSGTPINLSSLNPYVWWRMGDGDTYPTIIDHGSGGNDGTMTNMSASSIVTDVP